jgi:hypothetical protein
MMLDTARSPRTCVRVTTRGAGRKPGVHLCTRRRLSLSQQGYGQHQHQQYQPQLEQLGYSSGAYTRPLSSST